jgi:cytoskeletal protein RodZ
MRAYKGFDRDLQCRGYQFVLGESYEEPNAEVCVTGFHAVTNPLDALAYYVPADGSRYCEVEVDDDAKTHDDDSKVASRHLSIGVELGLPGIIKAGLSFVWEKVEKVRATNPDQFSSGYRSTAATSGYQSTAATSGDRSTAATSGDRSTAATSGDQSTAATSGDQSTAATSGDRSTAATSGYRSTAATSGYRSTAATSGYRSTAATSGYRSTAATSGYQSTAATSGYQSTAAATGKESIAVAAGYDCTAKGAEGCWLVLVERENGYYNGGHILGVKSVRVDGKRIKPGVAYKLVDGKVVKA